MADGLSQEEVTNQIDLWMQSLYPDKTKEITINMFISLSSRMIRNKHRDINFNYTEMIPSICDEFSSINRANLDSRSDLTNLFDKALGKTGYGFEGVDSRSYESKLNYIIYSFCDQYDVDPEKAELLLNNNYEKAIYNMTLGNGFISHPVFRHVYEFKDNEIIRLEDAEDRQNKRVQLEQQARSDYTSEYLIDDELTRIMKIASDSIIGGAGKRRKGIEIKILYLARTAFSSILTYFLDKYLINKVVENQFAKIFIGSHLRQTIDKWIKYLIKKYDARVEKQYTKYDPFRERFNDNIERLVREHLLLPQVNDMSEIDNISMKEDIHLCIRMTAKSLSKINYHDNNTNADTEYVNNIRLQDLAAVTQMIFSTFAEFTLAQYEDTSLENMLIPNSSMNALSGRLGHLIRTSLILKGEKYELNKNLDDMEHQIRSKISAFYSEIIKEFHNQVTESPRLATPRLRLSDDEILQQKEKLKQKLEKDDDIAPSAQKYEIKTIPNFDKPNSVGNAAKRALKRRANYVRNTNSGSRFIESVQIDKKSENSGPEI
jgi:hypothetical protein